MNVFSSLELTRTDPAHFGTGKLVSSNSKVDAASFVGGEKPESDFEKMLISAMSEVNQQQLDVSNISQQLIIDPDSVDAHDVTIAMAKANMSLSIAQAVMDRVIKGWNEIITTR